ncbi:hypothetical protein KO481_35490 [Nocardia sp. NEAU-G5]|uniref:Uncharacterized protein n=1 Tax=Nocardia albiluteola TaxID=2842303 RepID=A0ABS6BAK7_9NOCA|nr:type VII secretion target [Nocardia albiluteola]MBU3066810.1 hypothetical protein [Nocardia albiluteola]
MEIELDLLRHQADMHDQAGNALHDGAPVPNPWLGKFIETYGIIASPVYEKLQTYYAARQNAYQALGDAHHKTAQMLRDSADSLAQADQQGGSHVGKAGDAFEHLGAGHTGTGPMGPTGPMGSMGSMGPSHPVLPQMNPDHLTARGVHQDTTPYQDPGAPPAGGPGSPTGQRPDGPLTALPAAFAPAQHDGPNPLGLVGVGGMGPDSVYNPAGIGFGSDSGGGLTPPGGGRTPPPGGPSAADATAPIMPTPFAAAVAAAKERAEATGHAVNGAADNDLMIARTLLAAVLAVVEDSVAGTTWAVSVMRGPAGAGVFITSNEGRGWLPAGLFLPREVSTPWLWDDTLDGAGSSWEGVSDPARVLVEFGLAWGPKAGAQLSALVSSGPIDPELRVRMNDVPMQGLVGPAYDVDLRVPTPDTVDRLSLAGSPAALERIAAVDDSSVRRRSIELAADAHARVIRSVPSTPELATARRLRENILAAVRAGVPVSRVQWDELRAADDLLGAALITRRVDPGRVEVGALRVEDEAGQLRAIVFERRCNELVLLLAAEDVTPQTLRDAAYAHGQVAEHPQFVEAPAAVFAPTPERVARPATGTVVAPAVSAGPPRGAVGPVPPVTTSGVVPARD